MFGGISRFKWRGNDLKSRKNVIFDLIFTEIGVVRSCEGRLELSGRHTPRGRHISVLQLTCQSGTTTPRPRQPVGRLLLAATPLCMLRPRSGVRLHDAPSGYSTYYPSLRSPAPALRKQMPHGRHDGHVVADTLTFCSQRPTPAERQKGNTFLFYFGCHLVCV